MDHQESWPFQVSPKTTNVRTLEYLCDGFNSMGIGVFRSFSNDMDRRLRRRMGTLNLSLGRVFRF